VKHVNIECPILFACRGSLCYILWTVYTDYHPCIICGVCLWQALKQTQHNSCMCYKSQANCKWPKLDYVLSILFWVEFKLECSILKTRPTRLVGKGTEP